MIKTIIQPSKNGNAIITIANGKTYEKKWNNYPRENWKEYCNKYELGLFVVVEDLISKDSEIDFELFGKFIGKTERIYTTESFDPVFNINVTEKILNPKGEVIEERKPNYLNSNISGENIIKWTKKYIPKMKLYNKVVLSSKYQIKHVNGLTYDFLYNMAKDLNDKNSFMMVGGGKGNDPLVFNDGGKPFRGFLEGRVKDKSYCLILHLSNQEFKGI